jgi:hypothetical protein
LITACAFFLDLVVAFRVSFMGVTDDKVSDLVLSELLGLVVQIQAKIVALLFAVALVLWLVARAGLGLKGRRAYLGVVAIWGLVLVRHARMWPAVYVDLRDVRPVPDVLFVGVVEGWLGVGVMAAVAGTLLWLAGRALWVERTTARAARALVGLGVVAGLFALAGHVPATPAWARVPASDPSRPDVLLLMADSWRSDHFECRGDSAITPRLGALCERMGRNHYTAYAAQPRTFGSVSALFTGLAPDQNGISHMMVRAEHRDLNGASLSRRFSELGYRTEAISGFAGDVFPRVNLGFDRLTAPTFGFEVVVREFSFRAHPLLMPFLSTNRLGREHIAPVYGSFMDLADPAFEVLGAYEAGNTPDPRPLFMTLFLSVSHSPYAVNARQARRRGADPVVARYRWHPPAYRNTGVDPALYPAIRRRYADGVQAVDDALATLAERALAQGNTIVVITSDHGELLYEFGEGNHGDHVFGDQHLAVPVVVLDGRAGIAPSPAHDAKGLYALKDTLATVLEAVKTRQPVVLPPLDRVFAESGIIISALGPEVIKGHRLDYPEMLDLIEMNPALGDMQVQAQWANTVELGKFRLMLTPDWAFVYSPGCKAPRMAMLPRGANARGLPRDSVGAAHPEALAGAWAAMEARWGTDLVRRTRCGLVR